MRKMDDRLQQMTAIAINEEAKFDATQKMVFPMAHSLMSAQVFLSSQTVASKISMEYHMQTATQLKNRHQEVVDESNRVREENAILKQKGRKGRPPKAGDSIYDLHWKVFLKYILYFGGDTTNSTKLVSSVDYVDLRGLPYMAVSKAWLNLIPAVLFPYLCGDRNITNKEKEAMVRKIMDECKKQFGGGPNLSASEMLDLFARLFPVPSHATKTRFKGWRNTGILVHCGQKFWDQLKRVKREYTSPEELAILQKLKFVTQLDSDGKFEIENCDLNEYAINQIKEGKTRNVWGKPASVEKLKDPVFQQVRRLMLINVFEQSVVEPYEGHVGLYWQASNLEVKDEEDQESSEEEEEEDDEHSPRSGSKAEVLDDNVKKRKRVVDFSRLPYGGKKPKSHAIPVVVDDLPQAVDSSLVDADTPSMAVIPIGSPLIETNF
jgi:hypothetical protein